MLVARRADSAPEACRRPELAAQIRTARPAEPDRDAVASRQSPRPPVAAAMHRAPPAATLSFAAMLGLACVPAALAQTVEIRVTNDFSRAQQISRDEFNCKPSPCVSTPSETIAYGLVGEPAIAASTNLAMATVFYKATANHKSYGCRFSLTVTKTRGSCDVAQILISPYLTQESNSPKCAILESAVPTYPDCRLVVTFAMGN